MTSYHDFVAHSEPANDCDSMGWSQPHTAWCFVAFGEGRSTTGETKILVFPATVYIMDTQTLAITRAEPSAWADPAVTLFSWDGPAGQWR